MANLTFLVGKLDTGSRETLEAAAGLCLSLTHYDVTIEHWLLKLLEKPAAGSDEVLSRFEVDKPRMLQRLNAAISEMKTGNSRTPALSPQIMSLLERSWMLTSIDLGEDKIRPVTVLITVFSDAHFADVQRTLRIAKVLTDTQIVSLTSAGSNSPEAEVNNHKGASVAQIAERGDSSLTIFASPVFHRRKLSDSPELVFALMPFTESWSNHVWQHEIKATVEGLAELRLTCKRADDFYGADVMIDVYESIASARLVIADITGRNANVFYELGIAHTLGKNVILLAQGIDHIPFDLLRFRHCIYSNDGPGLKRLRDYLMAAIPALLTTPKPTPSLSA